MNKWLKRAVCTAVIAAVTLLCLPCFAQSNTYDESFTDKLYAFGITDEDFSGENYITRGDLVKYAVRMNGMDISQFQQPSPFIDVTADTESAAYINAAYNLGLVNGVSDTQFMPGDFVTLEQAAKIMICIAGYGEIAKYKGGLPDGYMNTAVDLGLFKGVEADKDGYLTPTACARLMMNVLLCDAASLARVGARQEYSFESGISVLEHNLKIKRGYGIVETDDYTSIYGGRPMQKGYAEISGEQYIVGDTNVYNYLGYQIEFYYRTDTDEPELVYAAPKRGANNVITVDADDIVSADNYEFKYFTENSKNDSTEKLSKKTVCIYNKRQTVLTSDVLMPKIGSVTLIDNDGDGNTDVAVVEEYRLAVIGNIALKKDAAIISAPDNEDILKDTGSVIVTRDLKAAQLYDLKVGDVLLVMDIVAVGSGEKSAVIMASSKKIRGTVTGIWDDKITVDGEEYETLIDIDKSQTGAAAVFGLDVFGRIGSASFEGDRIYGFVKKSSLSDFDDAEVLIFTENGRWVQLALRDTLKYNGSTVKKEDFYNNILKTYVGMVTYRVGNDKKIYEMNTPQVMERWSSDYDKAIKNDVFRQAYNVKNQYYREYLDAIGTHIPYGYFTGETKIFAVPSLSSDSDPDDFAIINKSGFYAGELINADIYIYDTDEFNNTGACLLVGYKATVNTAGDVAVLNKTAGAVIDGRECFALTCMSNGTIRKYYTYDKNITVPKEGSVMLFSFNPEGFITNINAVYDASGGFKQQKLISGPNIVNGMFAGRIVDGSAEAKKFAVDYNHSLGTTVFSSKLNPKVYVYYQKRNIIEAGTEEDIIPGRYCFVKANNLRATTVVVFNE